MRLFLVGWPGKHITFARKAHLDDYVGLIVGEESPR
jgi:hypothetical protein